MEESMVIICLRVLKATNKDSHDSYCVNVPLFDSITTYWRDAQRNSGQQQIVTLLLVTWVKEIRRFSLLLSAEKGDDYFVGRSTLT